MVQENAIVGVDTGPLNANNSYVVSDRINIAKRTVGDIDRNCKLFEQTCRDRGVRLTPQRLAVYRALASDNSHPTAESIYLGLAPHMPGLSPATVYRILEFLENQNLIRRVSGTEGIGRFDANLQRHQHLVCRICGRLDDVYLPVFESSTLPKIAGFSVEELDIRIVGRCRDCSTRPADRRSDPSRQSMQTN